MFRERFGILSSVDFPAPYPKSCDCSYRIEVEEGFRLRLQFDSRFDVEDHPDVSCPYDYVKVRKHTDSCTHTQVLPLISCLCVRWKQEAGSSVRSVAIDHLELFRPTVTSSPSGSTLTALEKTSAGSSITPPKVRNKHLKEHRCRYEAPS